MEAKSIYFKLVSLLLGYPDAEFTKQLPALQSALGRLPAGRRKTGIAAFLDAVTGSDPIRLQECYTATFDLNPATTLNMTYHLCSDGEKRAAAMALLQQVYDRAGYVKATTELPDYLPLMLEFLAFSPEALRVTPFAECFSRFGTFVDRLREKAPFYADLLQPLADALQAPAEAGT